MVLFTFLSCLFLPIDISNKHTESELNAGECFSEIHDIVASKETFSTGKYFVKLLDVLLRWADINKNFKVLQTPHATALVLPYSKQNR